MRSAATTATATATATTATTYEPVASVKVAQTELRSDDSSTTSSNTSNTSSGVASGSGSGSGIVSGIVSGMGLGLGKGLGLGTGIDKTVVYFEIVVHGAGAVRSWSVWRRYSDFAALHNALLAIQQQQQQQQQQSQPSSSSQSQSQSQSLPPLPPKSLAFSAPITRLRPPSAAAIEERRSALELYLQAILRSTDQRWRRSVPWLDFLAVPEPLRSPSSSLLASTSSQSKDLSSLFSRKPSLSGMSGSAADPWMQDLRLITEMLGAMRSEISDRSRFAALGDVSAVQTRNVQLRKAASTAAEKLNALEAALSASPLATSSASKGEYRRRQDLLANIKEDLTQVTKLALTAPSTAARSAAKDSDSKKELLHDKNDSLKKTPKLSSSPTRSSRRFGNSNAQPAETDETRPLSNQGLLELQRATLKQQDTEIDSLAAIIRRQREIGQAIGDELDSQNQYLDEIDRTVDKVQTNLKTSDKKVQRILGKQ